MKDVGRLADEQRTRAQERRREDAVFLDRLSVDIVRAGILQREANELAAALDPGPVIELVAH
jgi:hypothetical protein